MQKFNITAPEVNTTADLIAYFRADGKHDIADDILIGSGSLKLHSEQDYYYLDGSPSIIRDEDRARIYSPTYDRGQDQP